VVSAELSALSLWWWRELKDTGFGIVDSVQPNRLARVVLVLGPAAATIKAQKSNTVLDDIVLLHSASGDLPTLLSEFWPASRQQRVTVEVALPPEKVLVRYLTLPAVSEREIGKILDLRMERELPLGREQVYIDWSITERDTQNRKLVVAIGIVRRAEVDRVRAAIAQWSWKPGRIGLLRGDQLQFNFLTTHNDARSLATSDWHRPLAQSAAVLAAMTVITLAGQWMYERTHVSSALQEAKSQLKQQASQRAQIVKLSEPATELRKLMATPSVADVLSDLTALLPTDTWVSDVEIQSPSGSATSIHVVGYTPTATELVNRIEASEQFSNVELVSATSAGVASGTDRVELTAVSTPISTTQSSPNQAEASGT
jgi:general secretion pathway protein L